MTTAQNNVDIIHRNYSSRQVVVTTNLIINPGDLVYWDPSNFTLTPLTAISQVSGQFFGLSTQGNASLIYPGDADTPGVMVLVRGVVWMQSTPGETYTPFQAVTVGADSQTVTKAGVTSPNSVGWVWCDTPTVPRAQSATPVPEMQGGAAQARIPIQLNPQHPVAAAI